jgi:hypothetical protein
MGSTDVHPVVAEARKLALVEPPDVLNILSVALIALQGKGPEKNPSWLYLNIDTEKNPEALPFSSPRPRMYRNIIRLQPAFDDFVLPLELIAGHGPSEWALLYFEEDSDGDQVTLIFHDLGPTPTRESVMGLLMRSRFFTDIRTLLGPDRSFRSHRETVLEYIEENERQRPENELQLARELVERHFSQVAA